MLVHYYYLTRKTITMKKLVPLIALIALACITFMSCRHHDRDVSISYYDGDRSYSMNAYFSQRKIRKVERYLERMLGDDGNRSFAHSRINGRVRFDDDGIIYIKKYPGHIKIKLNKYENSEATYERVREMCEGLKDVIIDKEVVVRVQ